MSFNEEFDDKYNNVKKPLDKIQSYLTVDNHFFNSNDFVSKPVKSKLCTINENIMKLQYPLLHFIKLY